MSEFTFVSGILRYILAVQQFLELPKNRIETYRFREGPAHLSGLGEDGTGDIVCPGGSKGGPDFTRELQHMGENWSPCQKCQQVNNIMDLSVARHGPFRRQ